MANYTYENENTREIYSATVGNDKVTVIDRVERDDPSGKFVVMVNGISQRWYAIERVAVAIARKYRIGQYGGTFGQPVNPTGKIC